jgi:hypothetical protein
MNIINQQPLATNKYILIYMEKIHNRFVIHFTEIIFLNVSVGTRTQAG